MQAETLVGLEGEQERHAAARSLAYISFAQMFEYPDAKMEAAVREGRLAASLRDAVAAVDPNLLEDCDWAALSDAGGDDDLAVEFTRLFDVGAGGPPCPLHGGLYHGARMKTMEEAVRFYNHFGLTLSEAPRELPDHLTTELEFLHFLTYREAETLAAGGDAGPWRRAQRDFVSRHPARWVPKLRERLEAQDPMPFFRELVRGLASFLSDEAGRLKDTAAA